MKWWIAIAAAAPLALVGAVSIGVVLAQDGDDGTGTPAATEEPDAGTEPEEEGGEGLDKERLCADFEETLAESLGVTVDELRAAWEETQLELLDRAVANGRLAPEEADNIREKIQASDEIRFCAGFGHARGHRGPLGRVFEGVPRLIGGAMGVEPSELAEFFGVLEEELILARVEGQSLAEIAEANGKTREELIAFLTEELQAELDEAVAAGEIEQMAANDIAADFAERADDIIDQHGFLGFNLEIDGTGPGGLRFSEEFEGFGPFPFGFGEQDEPDEPAEPEEEEAETSAF
jgi:hypothetical protein